MPGSLVPKEFADESSHLACHFASLGSVDHWIDVRFRRRLRQGLKGAVMVTLAALVTGLLFVYLLIALLRPEWF